MTHTTAGDLPPLDPEILEEFKAFVADSVAKLTHHAADLEAGNNMAADRIFEHAHNLKGIGTTFGFDLLSDVSGSLCVYIKSRKTEPSFRPAAVTAHVQAIARIVDTPLVGDGGQEGVSMLARLLAITSL